MAEVLSPVDVEAVAVGLLPGPVSTRVPNPRPDEFTRVTRAGGNPINLVQSNVRLLDVECQFTDDYLLGHARRVGLAADSTPQDVLDRLLPTIRYDVRFESDRLRDAVFDGFHRIREDAPPDENALPLARFLGIPVETARDIAASDYLFRD